MWFECFLLLFFLFRTAPGICLKAGDNSLPPCNAHYRILPLLSQYHPSHMPYTGYRQGILLQENKISFLSCLAAGKFHSEIQANPERRSLPQPCLAAVVVLEEMALQVPAWSQSFPGCLPFLHNEQSCSGTKSLSFTHWGCHDFSHLLLSSIPCRREDHPCRRQCLTPVCEVSTASGLHVKLGLFFSPSMSFILDPVPEFFQDSLL